ncbi:MAG: DNA-directed RNA polymerase subunit beta' [Verrucomicrobiota bacterium]|nr:DNA-directed RNA polymerase subunit beta' [Verrucomicrobiota bacterium]
MIKVREGSAPDFEDLQKQRSVEDLFGISQQDQTDFANITLASPEAIRSWSKGEVKNPETINYRTFKPEKGGLFCERIFGPTKDWECSCGKYKRIKHKGVICDRCGVEVTLSRVRRERMAHIELAVPVSHIWFFKATPSRMGLILDMTMRDLERVLYYDNYIVTDEGNTPLSKKQLLSEEEYREAIDNFGIDSFEAKIGAEGIRELLTKIDPDTALKELEEAMMNTRSKQTRKKLVNQMKVMEGFLKNSSRPEWMILEVLPVIPPNLRPLVPLEGGRFATSDLNDLYRRVINRNNRLKTLLALKTPEVIIRNEKRMLQQSVDALFDNGRHGRAVTGPGNRPLKSLSDMLKGKQGRFRQNLLGKRVDYSGRSVIVVGPSLKLNQCGLPKKMALVLFEPFIIRRLKERGVVHTVRSAKKMIEREVDEVWDILDEVTKGHTVMLNRAPTLHRLSIQSFEPILIEGQAIQLHPLVCTAYNADFDGDQMAVHVPLSVEAQVESKSLMLATNNIFSPSSGKPVTTPTQDIALGCYFVTSESQQFQMERKGVRSKKDEALRLMNDIEEVQTAYDEGVLKLHDRISYRNPDYQRETRNGDFDRSIINTTVGRVFFNQIWPEDMGFSNKTATKKVVGTLIEQCYEIAGHAETVIVLDKLKNLGYEHATRSGMSIGLSDMIIPEGKSEMIAKARAEIEEIEEKYRKGLITEGERYNMIIDIWTDTNDKLTNKLFEVLEENDDPKNERSREELNPVYSMVDSGARGSRQQIRQLAGMRGLMAKPSGEIIERPILSNFREGLSVLEYFISTHGARKGLADTALKTADSGYLTRKLVDVSHDIIITEEDCNTLNGIEIGAITEGDEELVSLGVRILGRTAAEDICDPHEPDTIIVAAGELIDKYSAQKVESAGVEKVIIRSVLTCESRKGVCALCYGLNLATGKMAQLGQPVGIIAAQSIGEPGTQLTMRTFHIGGTASSVFKQPRIISKSNGIVKYDNIRSVKVDENNIILNKNGNIIIVDEEGRELERYAMMIGAQVSVDDGGVVNSGDVFVEWDPYSVPILSEHEGKVEFIDFTEGATVEKKIDEATGVEGLVVMEHKEDLHPQIVIRDPKDNDKVGFYSIPAGAQVMIKKNDMVKKGFALARTPRKTVRTKDITGGLPRVAELVEARTPKDAAEIAKIEGVVELGGIVKGKRKVLVRDTVTGAEEEHLIPMNKHVIVFPDDFVKKGQQLTEGPIVPQELLEVCGPQELQEYLVNEVQGVYRLQGVEINDKHIEVIVRQMLRKVKITDPGDTEFLWGEQVEKQTFQEINQKAVSEGRRPAEASPVLLGITKAALETESFISAASFQDTTRVLTKAATLGMVDTLRGFKENVIMGRLIPAGSGFPQYRDIKVVKHGDEIPVEDLLGSDLLDPNDE